MHHYLVAMKRYLKQYGPIDNLRGINNMDTEMPRLDKTQLTVSSLDEFLEEKVYWLSREKADRLNAIETNRRMVYGTGRTTSRLQRFFETAELT